MRAPAFQWYAADYLADERVMQLTLASEAAYVRLLNYCWREGSIPANPVLCAPMCKYADAKVIKPALALFMKAPDQPGRLIHKRLEEERAKQEAFRAKQAEYGKKGGRPRKEDEKPEKGSGLSEKGYPLATLTQPLADPKASLSPHEISSLSSFSSSSTTVVVPHEGDGGEPLPLPAKKPSPKEIAAALTDPDDLQAVAESPLRKPGAFFAICRDAGYPQADLVRYAAQIAAKSEGLLLTSAQWRSRIINFLNNDAATPQGVMKAAGAALTPNEVPGNWDTARQGPYTAPMGQGIPHPSSFLKPEFLPR